MNPQHESNPQEMFMNYRTNDPYEIAQQLKIEIKTEDIPSIVAGIYTVIGNKGFAVVNERLDDTAQRYVVAVCIYYHVNKTPRILSVAGPADCDWSAGNFAYDLLSYGVDRFDGESAAEYNERIGIPSVVAELMKARLN